MIHLLLPVVEINVYITQLVFFQWSAGNTELHFNICVALWWHYWEIKNISVMKYRAFAQKLCQEK
jgi:hypothetical protein